MRHFNNSHKQSGTAIFMALLVVAIVTTISIIWFAQTRLDVRRTQQMLLESQNYLYADSVLDWAIGALIADDTLPKILPAAPIIVGQGVLSGYIDDYQASLQHYNRNEIKAKHGTNIQSREYFILRSEVRFMDQHLILYSLLHRKTINGKVQISIIWQSRGIS